MSANTVSVQAVDNVYYLPVNKNNLSTQDPSEILANVYDMKIISVEESLAFIVPLFFESLLTAGFKATNDRANTVLVALVRAIMHEHFGFDHPMIEFINKHKDELDIVLADQVELRDLDDSLFDD